MASTRVYRTLAANSEKKGSISVWFKLGNITGTDRVIIGSYYDGTYHSAMKINSDDRLNVFDYRSGFISNLTPYRILKDPAAWYHVVFEWDTTQGAAADRNKIYINGVQETSFETETNYSADDIPCWNRDYTLSIGARNSDQYYDGEMSHLYFIQGYAYAASTFGSTDATSGIWKINTSPTINYTGTGTNSSFLKFEDSSNMDLDSGSNTNTFTTAGTLTASKDNPSNNFNCPNQNQNRSGMTFLNGGTTMKGVADSTVRGGFCNFALNAGKWYYELRFGDTISGEATVGICDQDVASQRSETNINPFSTDSLRSYGYRSGGNKITAGTSAAYGNTYADGDDIGCAMDLDAGNIWFSIDGVWQNSATIAEIAAGTTTNAAYSSIVTGKYYVVAQMYENLLKTYYNFGQGSFSGTAFSGTTYQDSNGEGIFKYEVPSGFLAMCTKNISTNG
jgi:hypothetical protein